MTVWQAPSGLRGALAKQSYTRTGFAEAPGAAGGDLGLGGGWAQLRLEMGRRAFGLRAQRTGRPAQAGAAGLNWETGESTDSKMDRGGRTSRAWTQGKSGEERKELGNVVSIPLQLTERLGNRPGDKILGDPGRRRVTEETRDGQTPVNMPSSPPLHTPQHTHTPYCTRMYTQKHTSTTHIYTPHLTHTNTTHIYTYTTLHRTRTHSTYTHTPPHTSRTTSHTDHHIPHPTRTQTYTHASHHTHTPLICTHTTLVHIHTPHILLHTYSEGNLVPGSKSDPVTRWPS